MNRRLYQANNNAFVNGGISRYGNDAYATEVIDAKQRERDRESGMVPAQEYSAPTPEDDGRWMKYFLDNPEKFSKQRDDKETF